MRALLSWSSGKDSAWALHVLRARGDVEIVGLLTTVNAVHDRVAMHAVRRSLLVEQARACGLPLREVPIPSPCPNDEYERAMAVAMDAARAEGIAAVAFGDLFLEDIRQYRERQLASVEMKALFPLWELPTGALARDMIAAGLRARITCVDPKQLSRDFAGREFAEALLADLPATVDPCGERGEFHTFAYAGPMFVRPMAVETGEVVERDGFVFADMLPLPFPESLCHACAAPPKYVRTPHSTFIRCPLLPKKYPPQPVRACEFFRPRGARRGMSP